MSDPEGVIHFFCEGRSLTVKPGRITPGQPSEHICDATGKHISLAFRERSGDILFDLETAPGNRTGFRLSLDTLLAVHFPHKTDYWKARELAGWPARKKARA